MAVSRIKRATLVLGTLAVLPVAAQAQQSSMPADPQTQQQVATWVTEMQQIQGQLQQLQMQALQDEQLSATQEQVGERIRTAMAEIDPTLEQTLERAQAIETEAATAQQAGDAARLEQLGAEMQQIDAKFQAAQRQAFQNQELVAMVQAFQERVERKMVELDPTMEERLARLEELQMQLTAVMQENGS